MEIKHNWDVWKRLTDELENTGKLDELETELAIATRRGELYNQILRISDTVEQVVMLAFYAGMTQGQLMMLPPEYRFQVRG